VEGIAVMQPPYATGITWFAIHPMKSPCKTRWLPRAVALGALALAAASCGPKPGAGNPGAANPNQGERLWVKIVENLDDADAQRVLTMDHFAKICEGMTLPEVAQLLSVKVPAKKPAETGCWITWQGSGKKIAVHLYAGKVSRKQQEGLKGTTRS
jgi:hypothetical protein